MGVDSVQKSYLVKQTIDFGQQAKFIVRPGDILVFDGANQSKVVVYRGGEIVKVLANQSLNGLQGLVKSGWLAEIHAADVPRPVAAPPRMPPAAPQKASGTSSAPENGKGATSTHAQRQKPAKKTVLEIEPSTV